MSSSTSSSRGVVRALAAAWLAGAASGLLFLLLGVLTGRDELSSALPDGDFHRWVTLGSVATFAWLGGIVGLVLGGVVQVVAPARLGRWLVPGVLGGGAAVATLAHLAVWWQLEVLAGLPLGHGERLPAMLRHGAVALVVGVVVTAVAARLPAVRGRWPTWLAAGCASLALVAFAVSQLALGLRRAEVTAWRPSQVVLVAVDGVTLRVLGPMLARGELPTFQRLIDDGAWGSILTYGVASSPVVWTSVATGKRARDHGIVDFVTKNRGSYRARPMRSTDWRARAVWSILGDADREVGVVNWLMSAPPQPVRGAMVTQLDLDAATARTYPPALGEAVAQVLARRADAVDGQLARWQRHVDYVFDTADMLLDTMSLDFLALYQSATDAAEHTTWRDYEPAAFDAAAWPSADAARAEDIPAIHRHLDARLGALLGRLDDDALLIVVSDHGQLAAAAPRVRIDLDGLLLRLGHARPEAESGDRVDRRHSDVYPLVETKWTPALRINVNLEGREHDGVVTPAAYRDLVARVATSLESIRFADGKPLFGRVSQSRRPSGMGNGEGLDADLVLEPGRRSRDAAALDELVTVGGASVPLRQLVEVDTEISGDHDRQGVLFVHGRGIRPGPIGQRTLTTALHRLVWHLTDRVAWVDALLPTLGRLGVIERATTLDITPTVLYAFGLPVARDMAGRPLRELFGGERPVTFTDSYGGPETLETSDEGADADADADADAEMLERLRALGYVN